MRFAIIGRTEILYKTTQELLARGHELAYVVTAKEAPEYTVTREDFKALAEKHDVPFISSSNIDKVREFLADCPPAEVAVSINFSGIIPQDIIDRFPLGVLNAHGGDLPKYRGNACQAWALINGEERIGLCIHSMIGGELDNGNILARSYLPVTINTKIGTVWQWMEEQTPSLYVEAIDALSTNPDYVLEVQSTNPEDALRCYPRRPEDGRIDWNKRNVEILRLVNASGSPYAGAFCMFEDEALPIIVRDAELLDDGEIYLAVAGQIAAIHDHAIDVITGEGKLRLTVLEQDGKVLLPRELVRSVRQRFC